MLRMKMREIECCCSPYRTPYSSAFVIRMSITLDIYRHHLKHLVPPRRHRHRLPIQSTSPPATVTAVSRHTLLSLSPTTTAARLRHPPLLPATYKRYPPPTSVTRRRHHRHLPLSPPSPATVTPVTRHCHSRHPPLPLASRCPVPYLARKIYVRGFLWRSYLYLWGHYGIENIYNIV